MGESEPTADSEEDTEATEADESPSEKTESTSEVAESTEPATAPTSPPASQPPSLGSRILITWAGLTAVTVIGGFLSAALSGPVGFIVYLATSLAVVAVLLYNVNELVKDWVAASQAGSTAD
ncbi:hypothetical protein [Haloparvum sp. PAK95]|uniref:hypothetical protein n=1 Tax=Haloparvum sp. PAK95 TaxID=3418962 RepID=UPI003D2EBAF7